MFAPDVGQVSAYASTPFATESASAPTSASPWYCTAGSLMATLCAFDPSPRPDLTAGDSSWSRPLHALTRAYADLRGARSRKLERAEAVAFCDALTGLYNRRGWDQLLKAEESRCRRHGRAACIVSVDLDVSRS